MFMIASGVELPAQPLEYVTAHVAGRQVQFISKSGGESRVKTQWEILPSRYVKSNRYGAVLRFQRTPLDLGLRRTIALVPRLVYGL